jgi:transcriptional regulator with XRE-family HTH domain
MMVVTWTPEKMLALRIARRQTMYRWAMHLGVNPVTISRWENGITHPSLTFLGLYDTALAQSSDEIKQRFRALVLADQEEETHAQ